MNYKLNRNLICKNKKKEKIFVCHLITLETTINPNRLTRTHTHVHTVMILKNERHTRGSLKAVVVRQLQKPRATFLLNLTCTATTPKGSKSHGARAARCASHSLDTLHAKPFHRGSVAEDEHRECVPLTLTFIPDWMTPQHLQHG